MSEYFNIRFGDKLLRLVALLALLLVAAGMLTSCSSDDEHIPEVSEPQVVFLFSPGGLGDMSYNDGILRGLQQFKKDNPTTDVFMSSPQSLAEAERIFSDWLDRPVGNIPVLFVLGSSDYLPMAEKLLATKSLTDNKYLLLFETNRDFGDPHISTFRISMYGASYLAGCCASQLDGGRSLVVLGNNNDAIIQVARDGFVAGHGDGCDVEALADDWTGYVQATETYHRMEQWSDNYGFIFPVAGGSNAGIYRYSREFDDCPYLAGMDTDQSSLSNRITGSVIKRIDLLVYEYLSQWQKTYTLPEANTYGLESSYADWLLADRYKAELQQIVNRARQQAIASEKQYYETAAH